MGPSGRDQADRTRLRSNSLGQTDADLRLNFCVTFLHHLHKIGSDRRAMNMMAYPISFVPRGHALKDTTMKPQVKDLSRPYCKQQDGIRDVLGVASLPRTRREGVGRSRTRNSNLLDCFLEFATLTITVQTIGSTKPTFRNITSTHHATVLPHKPGHRFVSRRLLTLVS